jgi:hypothetical protein
MISSSTKVSGEPGPADPGQVSCVEPGTSPQTHHKALQRRALEKRNGLFHARYQGRAASVDFHGKVIADELPRRAHALVAEWTALHQDELLANRERARRDESLESIEPLP